ncbi:glycosyltransferase [Hungatella hathewayi]|uniref:glycosyltransferase n=1 Tax=Hungatella hathewayi TaxID=154046 RepID=UPI003568DCE8
MKTKSPLVSIIIPVYNGGKYLKEAIASALDQTYENCEVLVINDGSCDEGETERMAQSFGDRIRYFSKPNGGVSTALNLGIANMKGEYFSWLSHDDLYQPDKVKCQVEALYDKGCPDGISFCNFTSWNVITDLRYGSELEERYPEEQLCRGNFAVWTGGVHGCGLLIHRSHFDRVGKFRVDLKSTQDYDLWFRMFRRQKLVFVREELVIGRIHPEQGSQTIKNHLWSRKELYRSFHENFTKEEMEWEFGSEYKFYSDMLVKYNQWGFAEAVEELRRKVVNLEEPKQAIIASEKIYEELEAIFGGRFQKLCIFGAGVRGKEMVYDFQSRGVKVDCFADNDIDKQGKELYGVRCISPDQIESNTMAVAVSMDSYADTIQWLRERGITMVAVRRSFSLLFFRTSPLKKYLLGSNENEQDAVKR